MQHDAGNFLVVILLLSCIWWWLKQYAGTPYRIFTRTLKRIGRPVWNVIYRTPAIRRGTGFGIFWLASWIWGLSLIITIVHHGSGWEIVLVMGLLLIGYKLMLNRWERHIRAQQPLPQRRHWR